jgi:hypothetical protein
MVVTGVGAGGDDAALEAAVPVAVVGATVVEVVADCTESFSIAAAVTAAAGVDFALLLFRAAAAAILRCVDDSVAGSAGRIVALRMASVPVD